MTCLSRIRAESSDLVAARGRISHVFGLLAATTLAAATLSHTVQAGPGRATAAFRLHEPYGVVLLFRATVPQGASVKIEARIPGVAGVSLSTSPRDRKLWSPALTCRRRGRFDVCVQRAEWCPMPEATWRFRLTKTSGPAGPIRVDFVVGDVPA